MSLAPPPPVSTNPFRRLFDDLRAEAARDVPFPPGDTTPSLARTKRFADDPLPLLLDAYERYGPVFTLRIFHGNVVFMLGPEANHYVTVSHADNFRWRDGHMGDLIPLLGDGLLTIDGEFHRRSRKAMLPAFHRERIAAATRDDRRGGGRRGRRAARRRARSTSTTGRAGSRCGSRCARCSASTPTARRAASTSRTRSRTRLGFYARDYFLQVMRGPGHAVLADAARARASSTA